MHSIFLYFTVYVLEFFIFFFFLCVHIYLRTVLFHIYFYCVFLPVYEMLVIFMYFVPLTIQFLLYRRCSGPKFILLMKFYIIKSTVESHFLRCSNTRKSTSLLSLLVRIRGYSGAENIQCEALAYSLEHS